VNASGEYESLAGASTQGGLSLLGLGTLLTSARVSNLALLILECEYSKRSYSCTCGFIMINNLILKSCVALEVL
jgi:hypothetical protein